MCLAIPGKIETVEGEALTRVGRVAFGSIVKDVNLGFVPDATIGDYVLVHVGVAIRRIDEAEAQEIFGYLEQIGDLDEIRGLG